MAKINLLPWRAERRERRKREFFTQLGLAALVAIGLVMLWAFWMSMRVSAQNDRNAYLTDQIKQLDAKITEIKNLQEVKDHLLARKRIVEKLQSSRSQMVHLFDQIVATIPSGARITGLRQKGDTLTIDGVAQSNATVAQYMRNIESSPWMGPTHLVMTLNARTDANAPYEFELQAKLGTPEADDGAPASAGSTASPPAVSDAAVSSAALAPVPASVPAPATSEPVASAAAQPAPVAASAAAEHTPPASATKGGAKP